MAVENTNGFGYCLEDYVCIDGFCSPSRIEKEETVCSADNYKKVCSTGTECVQNLCKCGTDNCGASDGECCRDGDNEPIGCFDLKTDKKHCGACGISCKDNESCMDGKCCTACDGKCVNLENDRNNCGECNNICKTENVENSASVECRDGACNVTQCKAGYALEDGECIEKPFVFTVEVFEPNTTVQFNTSDTIEELLYRSIDELFQDNAIGLAFLLLSLTFSFDLEVSRLEEFNSTEEFFKSFVDSFQISQDIDKQDAFYYNINCGSEKAEKAEGYSCHYSDSGIYTIEIKGDVAHLMLCVNSSEDAWKLTEINHWGSISWKSLVGMFYKCKDVKIMASDTPDFSQVRHAEFMFAHSENITLQSNLWNNTSNISFGGLFWFAMNIHGIETWDTSNVINMSHMFTISDFNLDISNWNTKNVTNMNGMFELTLFNQNINSWDVSNVKTFAGMFLSAQQFNQPLSAWNLQNATRLNYMFCDAHAFNQPIGNWNIKNVNSLAGMFSAFFPSANSTSFNQPIESWDTGNVKDMQAMFSGNADFNQPIGNWDTSKVRDMREMFFKAESFNQNISDWDVSQVRHASRMFDVYYTTPIDGWNLEELLSDEDYKYQIFTSEYDSNHMKIGYPCSKLTNIALPASVKDYSELGCLP